MASFYEFVLFCLFYINKLSLGPRELTTGGFASAKTSVRWLEACKRPCWPGEGGFSELSHKLKSDYRQRWVDLEDTRW